MLLSIDVNDKSLLAVEGSYSGGIVSISKASEMKLPPNTISDGEITNHASFIMSLEKLLASTSFSANSILFTLNSSHILSRKLDLPASNSRDMAKMVKNELLQMVNEASEYIYEYSLVKDSPVNANVKSVWAYAVPKDLVDEYYAIRSAVKLKLAALDVHPNSVEKLLINAAVNGNPIGEKSTLFVDLSDETMEIHLFSDGQRAFSRMMPLSSSEFKMLLGNAGAAIGEHLEQLDITSEPFTSDSILIDALHQYVNQIGAEIQKMMQFQLRRNAANPVTNVYIYGSMACIRGFAANIGSALGIPVESVESVSKIKAPAIPIAKYLNAIGALIRL